MSKDKRLANKNRYQQCIHIYLKRREECKAKYGKRSKKYLAYSKRIQRKLTIWRGAVKRIDIRETKIKNLDNSVNEFIGRSVFNSTGTKDKLTILARNLFVRYGIENGIQGVYLAEFIGLKFKPDASRYRLQFIRSFKTNKDNREMWHRFLKYMQENNLNIKQAA